MTITTQPSTDFNPATRKLYIITRRDLTPGQQLAQSVHAALDFADVWPGTTEKWMQESNHVCILSVKNEADLRYLYDKARYLGIKVGYFVEPDLDLALTAIALEPTEVARDMVRTLPLALRQPRWKRWLRRR